MEIRISEDYRIMTDKLNYILQERKLTNPNHRWSKSNEVQEKWIDLGYFSKLNHLTDKLVELEVKKQVVNDLVELGNKIEELQIKLTNKIERLV